MSVIGFIGDSITIGFGLAGSAPPILMCAALTTQGVPSTPNNQAANGASTADWMLQGNGKLLTNAINAFSGQGVDTVLIMLGTNDSKPWIGITPAQYEENLRTIITVLKANGIQRIILNQPPYIKPSGSGIPDPTTENALLQQYQTKLQALAQADTTHVLLGDQAAFSTFQEHADYYQADGIHPNDAGAAALSQLWKAGYLNPQEVIASMSNNPIITPGGGPVTPGAGTVIPASISQAPATFVFPQDLQILRDLIGGAGTFIIEPGTDGVNSICIKAADGTVLLSFNTQTYRAGFYTPTPQAHGFIKSVDINGDVFITNILSMGAYSGVCLIDMSNPYAGLGLSPMTQAQRRAIGLVAHRAGNTVFCTDSDGGDTPGIYYDDGAAWNKITATPAAS